MTTLPKYSKAIFPAIAAFVASTPASACAHKETALDCHIEGAKFLGTELSDAAVCDRFVAAMGASSVRVAKIHIEVTRLGSINVRLTQTNGESSEMGMDVLDRPLRLSDLEKLAQTVGEQL